MGKKVKVGKQRRDKFYQLAKETGYRSRAAFKLVQLNRRFEFLQKCRVLVDLCAAPGGWCQVAAENMAMSSVIIGVDLVPIRAIRNVITLQQDIRTDACKQAIKKEMKNWLADCVLHDGAPNVGRSWIHDAFSQAQLTLTALKLACGILKKNGTFVTKIFRSKDYPSLLTVFGELFTKVNATKPQASRNESAEIFVVCSGYKKPDKMDPNLLDPKSVFKELHLDPEKPKLNLLKPEKAKKAKAEGYAEGATQLHVSLPASLFLFGEDYIEKLGDAHVIELDDIRFKEHPATTAEILACLADIKVCGRRELKYILTWRKKLKQAFGEKMELDEDNEPKETRTPDEIQEEKIAHDLNEAKVEEKAKSKRKKRKDRKAESKRKEHIKLGMIIPNDQPEENVETDLFNLLKINSAAQQKTRTGRTDSQSHLPQTDILVDFTPNDGRSAEERKTDEWFEQGIFEDIDLDEDNDDQVIDKILLDRGDEAKSQGEAAEDNEEMEVVSDKQDKDGGPGGVVSEELNKLDAVGLAMGSALVYSSKSRRDLIESAFNRYMKEDDNLPAWFVDDEKKHFRPVLPVSKELVAEYKAKQKALDARPIKKVAEAKSRKRKRVLRKELKAKKRAQSISDNPELSETEKAHEMKKVYKQTAAAINKKVEVKYVVAKRGQMAKRAQRPSGVSGRYKVVDPRQKKDLRSTKAHAKAAKKKGPRSARGPPKKKQKK